MDMEFNIPLEISSFESDKQYNAFINATKRIIRNSVEYKEWVKYIKYTIGYDYCDMTKESSEEVTVDLHHHPISLENIVKIVIENKLKDFKPFSSFDIAKEVMQLHYDNHVGYILLVKTLHEKFHNGYLKLPIDLVHGNYKYILENYYIPEDIMKTINSYMSITLEDIKREYGGQVYKWSRDEYTILYEG
jgi:hypothetical protein